MVSPGAAGALYDDQGLVGLETLKEVDDKMVDSICRAITKPGGGHPRSPDSCVVAGAPQVARLLGAAYVEDLPCARRLA